MDDETMGIEKKRKKQEVYILEPGDMTKTVQDTLYFAEMDPIDLHNSEQLKSRLVEYFSYCAQKGVKPGVAGLSLALGTNRQRLWEINNDAYSEHRLVKDMPKECRDLIKKAYLMLESLWESLASNGKINPVLAIFFGKNHFGYKDQTEQVVVTKDTDNDYSAEEIAKRYLPEPEKEPPRRKRGRKKKTE